MKRIVALLLCLVILSGCHAAPQIPKEEPQPPVVQEEPEPVPEEPEPAPVVLPSAEEIQSKTLQASICPCLAVEHAEWNLARHGFADYTGEPLNSVMDAFSNHITTNAEALTQTYGDLVNGTLWIIDHDEFGYYLQIIQFAEVARQLVMLQWDGTETTVFEEGRPMEEHEFAICSKFCDPTMMDSTVEQSKTLERLYGDDTSYFHRFSAVGNGRVVHTEFEAAEEDPFVVKPMMTSHYFPHGSDDPIPLYPVEQEPPAPIPPVTEQLLRMDYSYLNQALEGEPLKLPLVQDFVYRQTAEPSAAGKWDAPYCAFSEYEVLWWLRNPLRVFVEELEFDSELKETLLAMDTWEIEGWSDIYTITGTTNQNRSLSITITPYAMDSDDWLTRNRKIIQEQANNGEQRELIPDEVVNDFMDHILLDDWYGFASYWKSGDVEWTWDILSTGGYMLNIKCFDSNASCRVWATLYWQDHEVLVEDVMYV